LNKTVEGLRAQLASREQPRAPSPPRGGAAGGSSPTGVDNASLNAGDRAKIASHLRECWSLDDNVTEKYKGQSVRLVVTTDSTGMVRWADVAANDAARTSSGVARAFAEFAIRTVRNPDCARLPLPDKVIGQGQNHTFEITFRP